MQSGTIKSQFDCVIVSFPFDAFSLSFSFYPSGTNAVSAIRYALRFDFGSGRILLFSQKAREREKMRSCQCVSSLRVSFFRPTKLWLNDLRFHIGTQCPSDRDEHPFSTNNRTRITQTAAIILASFIDSICASHDRIQ